MHGKILSATTENSDSKGGHVTVRARRRQDAGAVAFLDLNLTGTATAAMVMANAKGHRTVLLTRDRSEYAHLSPDPLEVADEVADLDTFDVNSIVRTCLPLELVGLIAFDDYRLLPAAAARAVLGLPGPGAPGVAAARFKDETRRRTARSARPVRHAVVSPDDPGQTSPVGYPCVVKPLDDSASAGVRLCRDDEDYLAVIGSTVNHDTHARGYRCADLVLVEEALNGPEYSVEMLWDPAAEQWLAVGITQTFLSPEPYRREVGHLFPAPLDETTSATVVQHVLEWLDQLGVTGGVVHVELKLEDGVPALIEVNPRPAGGNIPTLVETCTGVDLIARYLELHLPSPPPLSVGEVGRAAALRFVVSGQRGTLVRLAAARHPHPAPRGLVDRRIHSSLVGRQVGATHYLGHVIATGRDPAAAWERAGRFHDEIDVSLEPVGEPL